MLQMNILDYKVTEDKWLLFGLYVWKIGTGGPNGSAAQKVTAALEVEVFLTDVWVDGVNEG